MLVSNIMSMLDIFTVEDNFFTFFSIKHPHWIADRAQRVIDSHNYSTRFCSCHVRKRRSYVDWWDLGSSMTSELKCCIWWFGYKNWEYVLKSLLACARYGLNWIEWESGWVKVGFRFVWVGSFVFGLYRFGFDLVWIISGSGIHWINKISD